MESVPYKLSTDMSFISVFDTSDGTNSTTTPASVTQAKKPLGIRSSGGERMSRLVALEMAVPLPSSPVATHFRPCTSRHLRVGDQWLWSWI